ncbi:uncharacterized protein LOC117609861 isoform X3 [Osmia lignaria lignaria]|uniref:uncharacterized protein LOC117609861 isoform X3 n=1 Tax=Osmia lignaria lignaria TaxID=1437193 RepID=UPI00402B557E
MYRLTRNQGFLQCIHGLLPVNDNTPSGPLSLWIFIMNCSTIGLELSSLIKAPTVAVKQKCPETSMSCQSLRQMEVEVFRAPRNPILNKWDQSIRPPAFTRRIPGVPMAPAPSKHRGHRRIPCVSRIASVL